MDITVQATNRTEFQLSMAPRTKYFSYITHNSYGRSRKDDDKGVDLLLQEGPPQPSRNHHQWQKLTQFPYNKETPLQNVNPCVPVSYRL